MCIEQISQVIQIRSICNSQVHNIIFKHSEVISIVNTHKINTVYKIYISTGKIIYKSSYKNMRNDSPVSQWAMIGYKVDLQMNYNELETEHIRPYCQVPGSYMAVPGHNFVWITTSAIIQLNASSQDVPRAMAGDSNGPLSAVSILRSLFTDLERFSSTLWFQKWRVTCNSLQ